MDHNILKQCIKGNPQAQQSFYASYAPKLYAICLRYMADEELAKDVLQEVFITVFANLENFKGNGSLDGWLYRIAVNKSLTTLRKYKKYKDQSSLSQESIQVEESGADVVGALSEQEILTAIRNLPSGFREVINLYIIDGYSHKEISELLDITVDNSKQRLRRGRVLLQAALANMYYIPDEKQTG